MEGGILSELGNKVAYPLLLDRGAINLFIPLKRSTLN